MKIGGKTFLDSFRFGKNLPEARRKRRRHGNGLVWRWFAHWCDTQFRVSRTLGKRLRYVQSLSIEALNRFGHLSSARSGEKEGGLHRHSLQYAFHFSIPLRIFAD